MQVTTLFHLLLAPETGLRLSAGQWQDTLFILREAKLAASLYCAAQRAKCLAQYPDYVKRHLYSAYIYSVKQAEQIRFEGSELTRALGKVGIAVTFLKGAGYALRKSINSQGRICSDIDVLVAKRDLAAAEACLREKGWRCESLSDYDERYYRQWAHEIPPLIHCNRGTTLDMHHNLYLPISGRGVDVDAFIADRQQLDGGYFVLSPAASIMHSIIHLFTNEDSASWMRDLLDIIWLLEEHGDPSLYAELISLAKSTQYQFELYCCLKAIQEYTLKPLPATLDNYMQQTSLSLSKVQCWVVEKVILPAFSPEHPLVLTHQQKRAKLLVYVRGHWMKMPLPILIKHFAVKTFLAIRDQLIGKHHFDPKLPENPNW